MTTRDAIGIIISGLLFGYSGYNLIRIIQTMYQIRFNKRETKKFAMINEAANESLKEWNRLLRLRDDITSRLHTQDQYDDIDASLAIHKLKHELIVRSMVDQHNLICEFNDNQKDKLKHKTI